MSDSKLREIVHAVLSQAQVLQSHLPVDEHAPPTTIQTVGRPSFQGGGSIHPHNQASADPVATLSPIFANMDIGEQNTRSVETKPGMRFIPKLEHRVRARKRCRRPSLPLPSFDDFAHGSKPPPAPQSPAGEDLGLVFFPALEKPRCENDRKTLASLLREADL